jgi:uncharacterized repeat protein (TIGR01451 family)
MAAPHVAGLVGLLISTNPALSGQVDVVENIIRQTAVPVSVIPDQTCGGTSSAEIPNNTFGWGRIDAYAAFDAVQQFALSKTVSHASIEPGQILTYTLTVTHTHGLTATQNITLTDVIPVGSSYLTATLPHSFDGTTITWTKPNLALDETWLVELAVRVTEGFFGNIVNEEFQVKSNEVSSVSGTPIITQVNAPFEYYLILIFK